MDDNPRVHMTRTEVVNDPARIAAHPGMLSINTALQVDLYDQVNASYVRHRVYSGFGGQPDFVAGAIRSRGGHAVIALYPCMVVTYFLCGTGPGRQRARRSFARRRTGAVPWPGRA